MNYVIALIFILSLVSCDSKHGSKSKSCTLNDSPIDCTEMDSEGSSNGASLYAQVSSKIMIFDDFLEIKERNTSFEEETINGKYRRCDVSTDDIMGFHFHFDEKNLYIKMRVNEAPVIYKRIDGNVDSLYGSWKISEKVEDQTQNTILKISEENIQIIAECIYQN